MAQDNTPLNPVQIEAELINASNSVAKSIQPVSDAYNEWQQAKLNFKREYAIAYLDATGSVEDRKQIATRDTLPAAEEEAIAEAKYRRLADFQRSYRDKTSVYQTLAKSVNTAYQVAGTGERMSGFVHETLSAIASSGTHLNQCSTL